MSYPVINKDTNLCISIASRPGSLGATVHNAAFKALGLNYIYLPCHATNAEEVLIGVRAMGIRGCSVSMPFKQAVMPFLDAIDSTAENIGAVNTIVNNAGKLTGYNTDVFAVEWALEELGAGKATSVLILGAGGMARAVVAALRRKGIANFTVTNRTISSAKNLSEKTIHWENRALASADILINSTPLGMSPNEGESPIEPECLSSFGQFIDVVALPPVSKLAKIAHDRGLRTIPGYILGFRQALTQFRLYSNSEPPKNVMFKALTGALNLSDEQIWN